MASPSEVYPVQVPFTVTCLAIPQHMEAYPADDNIIFNGGDTSVKDTWTKYVLEGNAILAEPEDYITLKWENWKREVEGIHCFKRTTNKSSHGCSHKKGIPSEPWSSESYKEKLGSGKHFYNILCLREAKGMDNKKEWI